MQYTRNDWYVACAEADLAESTPKAVSILGQQLVLWRSGGVIAAFEDRCVHRAAALSLGRCEGATLRCMYHGILFNADGAVIEIPGQDKIPTGAAVLNYPLAARFGLLWIWMGDRDQADEALLPNPPVGVDVEDYGFAGGVLDFAAEARLVSDNLLDFGHLSFVHVESFGATDIWVQAKPKIVPLERGIRVDRWIENAGPGGQPAPNDHFLGYDYLMPGVLIMWGANYDLGTARALNFERPDFAFQGMDAMIQIQTITPTTPGNSRYHFRAGAHRKRSGGVAAAEAFLPLAYQAFHEDRAVIEAQQKVIDRDPDRPIMPTAHDQAIILYNRMKARRLVEEQGEPVARLHAVP
jgi:vanillate O-demethylase monooxygenase subunit